MKRLETERLILRDWTIEDAKDLYEYAKNSLVGPNAGWPPHTSIDVSKEIIDTFIKEDEVYAIELKETGKVIGSIGLHKRMPDESLADRVQREIGYVLNPDYWGHEYIPEAVKKVKAYAFDELKVDLLWCGHFDDNMKSKRVIEKCGFKYYFTKNEVMDLLDNKDVNTLYYTIENVDK